MHDSLYKLLKKLTLKNNIRLNQDELKLQLKSHPSYPSLHSVTGVLEHFGVPHVAAKIPNNREALDQTPPCFLAVVDNGSGNQLVLIERSKESVTINYQDKGLEKLSVARFLEIWTGIILAIEKNNSIVETRTNSLSLVSKTLAYILFVVLLGYVVYTLSDFFAISHLVLSVFGLAISIIIVKHDLGLQSSLENKICNLSENTSCDAILNSKGATLFGFIKLSDLCIVAFASCCLCWTIFAFTGVSNFTAMSIVTLLAFPFTIYSLFYQYKVIQKWCPLCLGIATILLLQTASLIFFDFSGETFFVGIKEGLFVLLSFVLITGIWSSLKPLLKTRQEYKALEVSHIKFKRNYSTFKALLDENGPLPTPHIKGEMVFGNQHAPISLTLVTSPFCFFCKEAHKDVERILLSAKQSVKVTIRLNVNLSHKEKSLYRVASELLHIYQTKGKAACLNVLNTLYAEDTNIQNWMEKQNIHYNPGYDKILQQQNNWCQENGINFTPALLVNGQKYPHQYNRTDILYFIDDLTESLETNTPIFQDQTAFAS